MNKKRLKLFFYRFGNARPIVVDRAPFPAAEI
jgi:hypothetical protein